VADDRKLEKGLEAVLARPGGWPKHAADACPEAEILAAYFERTLPEEERKQWEAHAADCVRCQEQLAALGRAAAAQPAPAPMAKPAFAGFFNWRWLVPAAATAALALAVSLRTGERAETHVAQVKPAQPEMQLEAKPPAAAPAPAATAETARGKATEQASRVAGFRLEQPKGAEAPTKPADKIEEFAIQRAEPAKPQAADAAMPPAPAQPVMAAAEEKERDAQRVAADSREAQQMAAARRQRAPAETAAPAAPPAAQAMQSQEARADEVAAGRAAGRAGVREGALAKLEPAPPADKKTFAAETRSEVRTSPVVVVSVRSKALWRIGVDGRVESSRDAGRTWRRVSLPEDAYVLAASAPEENVCWLAGRSGAIFRTTDGRTWEKLSPPSAEDVVAVRATDAQTAQVTLSSGRIYETRDAGRTWKLLP
jgi:hypothetical protein